MDCHDVGSRPDWEYFYTSYWNGGGSCSGKIKLNGWPGWGSQSEQWNDRPIQNSTTITLNSTGIY